MSRSVDDIKEEMQRFVKYHRDQLDQCYLDLFLLSNQRKIYTENMSRSGQGRYNEEEDAAKEICICAAVIAEDGSIMRGQRHSDCIRSLLERNKKPRNSPESQGFITSTGRFVTREEGRRLQDAAGLPSKSPDGYMPGTLFSEDLY